MGTFSNDMYYLLSHELSMYYATSQSPVPNSANESATLVLCENFIVSVR